jgi:hypothetical protein
MPVSESKSFDPNELIDVVRQCVAALKSNSDVEAVARRLCEVLPTGKSFVEANPRNGGRVVAFKLHHKPRTNPPTTELRRADLLSFAGMRLMDLVGRGRRFRFEPIQDKKLLYYIRFCVPGRGKGARIYFTRIVRNTLPGQDTPFARDHHSYLYKDLKWTKSNPRLPPSRLGRADAIKRARGLYQENPPRGLLMTAEEYEALLWEVFSAADRTHGGETA